MENTIKEKAQATAIRQGLKYLEKDPENNIPKLLDLIDKYGTDSVRKHINGVKPVLSDKSNNWYKLLMKAYKDWDPEVRKKVFENFIINGAILGFPVEERARETFNCNVPWAILMDMTSACNLHCTGCWAAEYGNRMNLTLDEIDSVVRQAKELGVYTFLLTGGEPFVRADELIELCRRHNDCVFSPFTNGTLITEEIADKMLEVGNLIPAFSIEGYEEENDFRRGKGVFKKIIRSMDILREKGLPFGTSLCYTRYNAEVISSEEYIDFLIEKGAFFSWIFTYIPVGNDADIDLVATPAQRELFYDKVREYRKTKPFFTVDFWNDGEYINGCIAGGRRYLHINANGDVEPCAFVHYSDTNIREKTLIEALQAPLFQQYRAHQPFNENLLRPCPMFDNVGALEEMVVNSGAVSTDYQSPEDIHELTEKMTGPAEAWAPVAQRIWDSSPAGKKAAERKQSNSPEK
jgi:MoaA/NifB/PqqE/SkfB family radical SAM enzyme